jgi:regulator of protease activity HflC (stomatin/prohibitin superfamily)
MTTLRNIVGGMDLEQALTQREDINMRLRGVLDEATGKWGIRVNRVELKASTRRLHQGLDGEADARRARQARRHPQRGGLQAGRRSSRRRARKQAAILKAEGGARAAVLRAEGEAKAIHQVFAAVHEADADPKLLAYQYVQALPQIAAGASNKVWVVPAELSQAMGMLATAFSGSTEAAPNPDGTARRPAARVVGVAS